MTQRPIHFFLPLYFDAASFLFLREKIHQILGGKHHLHFHLLDDSAGLDPETQALARLENVRLLTMPKHLGHQKALVLGLRQFLGETRDALVVTMDSDGEDRPEDLPRLLQELKPDSLVLAKRGPRTAPLYFHVFYFLYSHIFRFLTGVPMRSGNFALGEAAAFRKIIHHPYFDSSYSGALLAVGKNLRFVPCARGLRYEGRSKMTFLHLCSHGARSFLPFKNKILVRATMAASLVFLFLMVHKIT